MLSTLKNGKIRRKVRQECKKRKGFLAFFSQFFAPCKLADRLKIPISGMLGVLLRLVRIDVLTFSEANGTLGQMIVHGYRSPVENWKSYSPNSLSVITQGNGRKALANVSGWKASLTG